MGRSEGDGFGTKCDACKCDAWKVEQGSILMICNGRERRDSLDEGLTVAVTVALGPLKLFIQDTVAPSIVATTTSPAALGEKRLATSAVERDLGYVVPSNLVCLL